MFVACDPAVLGDKPVDIATSFRHSPLNNALTSLFLRMAAAARDFGACFFRCFKGFSLFSTVAAVSDPDGKEGQAMRIRLFGSYPMASRFHFTRCGSYRAKKSLTALAAL